MTAPKGRMTRYSVRLRRRRRGILPRCTEPSTQSTKPSPLIRRQLAMSEPFTGTRWSTRLLMCFAIILLAASLMGCSPKSMPPLRATLPQLPAQVTQPCPLPSQLPDGQIPTLIAALMDAWEGLAECEVKRAAAVEAYEAARRLNP